MEIWDHHCGVTSNCIAKNNMRFFIQLLYFTGLALGFNAIVNMFIVFVFSEDLVRKEV